MQVRACQRYTSRCSEYSDAVNGTTIDGQPSEPLNVRVYCNSPAQGDGDGHQKYSVLVTWEAPAEPNGQLAHYWVSRRFLFFNTPLRLI